MSDKIDTLSTACQLLKELSQAGRACSLAEVARMLDMPKSTAKRMLATLESERFLDKVGDGYQISTALARIWSNYRNEQKRILAHSQMELAGTDIHGDGGNHMKLAVVR